MSLSTVLSGGNAFVRRCIWKMYWWAMGAPRVARLTSLAVVAYGFIGPGHPLSGRLERFREAIAARGVDAGGATVHSDLTLRPGENGGLELHRAYWSRQSSGPE